MGFNLDSFKANFEGGAKQYLFYIKPSLPAGMTVEKATYLVMSSNLPGRTFEQSLAPWQGLDYKYAGKQTFADWDVTFRVDRKADIRMAFEKWCDMIHNTETNIRALPSTYMRPQTAQLLDHEGTPILTYTLIDAWPLTVAQIDLDYAGTDTAMFTVTFSYQYYKMEQGATSAGG